MDSTDFYEFLAGAGRAALAYGLISDPLGPDNPIGYDGYVFAPEAGLNAAAGSPQPQAIGAYCVRFRWYLPETGRWLQRDPAGYVDGMGLFEGTRSSPLVGVDPLGLWDVIFEAPWGTPWTSWEKARVRRALEKLVERVAGMLDELHVLRSNETLCVIALVRADMDLLELRLQSILDGLQSTDPLRLSQKDLGPAFSAKAKRWISVDGILLNIAMGPDMAGLGPDLLFWRIYLNVHVSADWARLGTDDLASLLFHELTHVAEGLPFGRNHDTDLNSVVNAHFLEQPSVMTRGLQGHTVFQALLDRARRQCESCESPDSSAGEADP